MTKDLAILLDRSESRGGFRFTGKLREAIRTALAIEYRKGRQDALDEVFATDRRKLKREDTWKHERKNSNSSTT